MVKSISFLNSHFLVNTLCCHIKEDVSEDKSCVTSLQAANKEMKVLRKQFSDNKALHYCWVATGFCLARLFTSRKNRGKFPTGRNPSIVILWSKTVTVQTEQAAQTDSKRTGERTPKISKEGGTAAGMGPSSWQSNKGYHLLPDQATNAGVSFLFSSSRSRSISLPDSLPFSIDLW